MRMLFLGTVAILGLAFLFVHGNLTGNAVLSCPVNYTAAGEYCVENACQNKSVRCMKQGMLIKRPDCFCEFYMGKPMCGILGGEKTAIKSPLCTRRGQVGTVCGAYDSNLNHCVQI